MAMHVAIALITYNLLVHLAPVRRPDSGGDWTGVPVRVDAVSTGPTGASRARLARGDGVDGGQRRRRRAPGAGGDVGGDLLGLAWRRR